MILILSKSFVHHQIKTDTKTTILNDTKNDPTLQKLYYTIQQGWPKKIHHLPKHFWNFRDEHIINNRLIYKGHCTYIPESLKKMLQKIHSNHMGAASNTRMAKEVLFWPGMSKDIDDICSSCEECAKYQRSTSKNLMQSLPIPSLPWQIVSQDLFE